MIVEANKWLIETKKKLDRDDWNRLMFVLFETVGIFKLRFIAGVAFYSNDILYDISENTFAMNFDFGYLIIRFNQDDNNWSIIFKCHDYTFVEMVCGVLTDMGIEHDVKRNRIHLATYQETIDCMVSLTRNIKETLSRLPVR